MRRIKRTQMVSFEGSDLAKFTDDFNRKMEWVERWVGAPEKYEVDLNKLRGYVIYIENVSIPEGIRDELELNGQRVQCEMCKNFVPGYRGSGTCKYSKGDLRAHDEACDKLFLMWEHGECWVEDSLKEFYETLIKTVDLKKVRGEGA